MDGSGQGPAGTSPAVEPERIESELWRTLLSGESRPLRRIRRMWQHLPNGPRCKVCAAPFHGPGRIVTRLVSHGRSVVNPTMCNVCFRSLNKHPGGAEVEISVLFADVRGSTGIAERIGAAAFREVLQAFYLLAARPIEDNGGFVDKYLGDGVMALFVPVIAGEAHSERAVAAGLALIEAVERSELPASGVRVGAGVHGGLAFVGIMGSGERLDFSALGDTVNVAARLGAIAGPGELLASRDIWTAAGRKATDREARRVDLVGRHEPLEVIAVRPATATS